MVNVHWRIVAGATLPRSNEAMVLVEYRVGSGLLRRSEVRLDVGSGPPLSVQLAAKLRALAENAALAPGMSEVESMVGTEGDINV